MQKNTTPISDFYQIPKNRVVEIGSQIELCVIHRDRFNLAISKSIL